MSCISVDTCVFIRLQGVYRTTWDCFLSTSDVIAITKEILKEYEGRAAQALLLLQSFLRELEHRGKMKRFNSSFIESAVKRYENVRRISYPTHSKDRKWIKVAIATRSKYIITTNNHLLRLAPNRYDDDIIEIIEPSQYTKIRCPNDN